MKITAIKVARTISDGNYGSNSLELSAEVGESKVEVAISNLKAIVDFQLTGEGVNPLERKHPKSSVSEGKPLVYKGKPKTEEVVETPKQKKATKKKAKKSVKTVKNVHVPYNRELQAHKVAFKDVLDIIDQQWRASKMSAKSTSVFMNGEDMYESKDSEKILQSFIDKADEYYMDSVRKELGAKT